MTHSPLPWRQVNAAIVDADGIDVCLLSPEDQALIVRAVNAHAALVAALLDIQARSAATKPGDPFVHSMNIVGAVNEISTTALELADA